MANPSSDLENRAPSSEALSSRAATSARSPREQLAAALLTACRARHDDELERAAAELRASVTAYIAALRDDGATVEHAVISTKELLAETIGGPNIPAERRAIAEQVVSWGIDAYYDSPARVD